MPADVIRKLFISDGLACCDSTDATHTHLAIPERNMHRENNFDAVRLLAAAVVIFGHAHPLTSTPDSGLLGNSVQALAVKIFFVISGYLICTSWTLDPRPISYLLKRSLRIFPALLVICILTIFIIGPALTSLPIGHYFATPHTYVYLKNVFLSPVYDLPGLFANNRYPIAVNGSLWSLPIEFAMYLLLPFVCFFDRLMNSKMVALCASIALCFFSIHFVRMSVPANHPVIYGTDLISALDVAPYFMIGALVRQMSWESLLNPVLALFFIGIVALMPPTTAVHDEIVLYFMLPYVVLTFALSSHRLLQGAGRFGDFSYGLYLYGFLVQQCVNDLSGNTLSALQNAFISLPIALVLAYLSWHLIEKPMLSLKPRKNLASKKLTIEEQGA
ncbi:acyltransferase family protein [Rhodanobacter sp. Col0626]|uniref:acyltransferase family protein n=1 Tax=Rhodanobacter sp. Col0626 TaxID=3415679 RepID=UPI003CEB247A